MELKLSEKSHLSLFDWERGTIVPRIWWIREGKNTEIEKISQSVSLSIIIKRAAGRREILRILP